MKDVFITKASKFLPNEPISNDEMDEYIGLINQSQSKAKRLVLRNNGIKTRYYAIDKQGNSTHSNAELTLAAINQLFDENFTAQDLELLSCGTTSPDIIVPSHAAMVHGLLKNKPIELNSSAGVCCAGMNALKYAYLSIGSGNSKNAISSGSEKLSTWMQSDKFEEEIVNLEKLEKRPIVAFKKDFLRYMLSDGAAAFLLEDQKRGNISLKIEWIDFVSYANELETCMYAGCEKLEDGSVKPWGDYLPNEWLSESIFSLKQDVKILDFNILEKGALTIKESLEKHQVDYKIIDYYLPHVSSNYFVAGLYEELLKLGIDFPMEKWFMNLFKVGNVGSASIYFMVEELMNSGKLKKGEKILLAVPESGRFSYSTALLTVC